MRIAWPRIFLVRTDASYAFSCTPRRTKATFGGVAFRLEKIETEIRHRDG